MHACHMLLQAPMLEPGFQPREEAQQFIDDVSGRSRLLTKHNAMEKRAVLTKPVMRPGALFWLQATGEGTHVGLISPPLASASGIVATLVVPIRIA